jgi:hypothetical protein
LSLLSELVKVTDRSPEVQTGSGLLVEQEMQKVLTAATGSSEVRDSAVGLQDRAFGVLLRRLLGTQQD